jgi:hypothetical protein
MLGSIIAWLTAGQPAHYLYLVAAAYALLEYILPRISSVAARSLLEAIANLLRSVPGVGVVFERFGTPRPAGSGASGSPGAPRSFLVLLATGATLLCACACFQPQNAKYNSDQCVIARQVVDCTRSAFLAEKDKGIQLVLGLIQQGQLDIPTLLSALKEAGFTQAECILAALDHDFLKVPRATAGDQTGFRVAWLDWRLVHRPGVTYRLPQ